MSTVLAHPPFARNIGGTCVLAVPKDATTNDVLLKASDYLESAMHYLNLLADSDTDRQSVINALYGVSNFVEVAKGLIDSVD